MSVFLAIILFISFTIGLNLGLHGVIVLDRQRVVEPFPTQSSTLKQSWQISHPSNIAETPQRNVLVKTSTLMESSGSKNQATLENSKSPEVPSKPLAQIESISIQKHSPNEPNAVTSWSKIQTIEREVEKMVTKRKETLRIPPAKYSNSPIVLLTCNRPQLLDETLKSALQVHGVTKDKMIIVQDGNMQQIQDVAKRYGIHIIQNQLGIRLRGGAADDGASRIAQHYKFALSSAFDFFKDAEALVIMEDDLLFAPDFYQYLTTAAEILDADPTTFVVSSWSDNGFKGKVHDPYAVRRTDFFPGLGWILTRQLYKTELEAAWPREHWDHWLRSPEIHKHRETIYPQVPRTFHNGVKGTFMNVETHNRYFKDVAVNTDGSINWKETVQHLATIEDIYEIRIEKLINMCKQLSDVKDLISISNEVVCVWIDVPHDAPFNPPPFQPISNFFGIWHEHKRGNHRGLHEFYWEGNYVLLINIYVDSSHRRSDYTPKTYRHLMSSTTKVMKASSFDKSLLESRNAKKVPMENIFKASSVDFSCDDVCQKVGKKCVEEELEFLNNCIVLKEYFPCTECKGSHGTEQPAYVRADAPLAMSPGTCLYNVDSKTLPIKCNAHHFSTYRLCSCK